MLVLSRKTNETILVGDDVQFVVLEIGDGYVKVGIRAPKDVKVHREEVARRIGAVAEMPGRA
jgi:carbon storage regulator